ncbi:hypothetical protein G5B30_01085 [Sphingobacterium sp. SGG-5]|uniref:hypothetical protein n=1 Tax=Sphingobacterium sp. SGG-5 TaxID=2710881 RepID=UPI0013EA13BC|nr:hypothetical protein [Sphingobacterium sp. SGG-5]NGM60497.1 hypothetical protein [Sphingobacterium sp. SGG-5]
MEKVVVLQQDVADFLENLIWILFEKEYFGFEESAQVYVSKIYDFIEFDLVNFPPKRTPHKLRRYGSKYVFYKANSHTTWYIFFESRGARYVITYITNNHMEDVNFL